MPTSLASVREDALESPRNMTATVSASGFKLTAFGNPNVDVLTVDASGNVVAAGSVSVASSAPLSTNLLRSAASGITAGTTQTQGGATALTKDINYVTTCANDNDGVKLPAAVVGMSIVVINPTAHTLKVYPAGTDDLGAGASTATTQLTTVTNTYYCYDAAKWAKV